METTEARGLTRGDAEGSKVGGRSGVREGEEARVEAQRRAVGPGVSSAGEEGSGGDGEEEKGGGRMERGVEPGVGRGDEGRVRLPGLGLVDVVSGVGGR